MPTRAYYNQARPYRALQGAHASDHIRQPGQSATCGGSSADVVPGPPGPCEQAGNVTVRYLSRLHHIGVGKAHVGEKVRLLIAYDRVRVVGTTATASGTRHRRRAGLPATPTLVRDVVRQVSTMS
jgi:hypothetical protein